MKTLGDSRASFRWLALPACRSRCDPSPQFHQGALRGKVTDAQNDAPVAGATVRLLDSHGKTQATAQTYARGLMPEMLW